MTNFLAEQICDGILPKGPCHIKNPTVILIHYSGGKKHTTAVKHYGRVSETPCCPGENSQEISTDSLALFKSPSGGGLTKTGSVTF